MAGLLDDELMLRQLAYSGTLEVTKVRKAGLNVRWELARFFGQYKVCASDMAGLRGSTMREQCRMLLEQCELDPDTWRVGRTLVFMASEEVPRGHRAHTKRPVALRLRVEEGCEEPYADEA